MRTHLTHRLVLASLALAATACKSATPDMPTETLTDVRATIEAGNATFSRLVAAGQADSVAGLYHPDAVLMLSQAPAAVGREAITATFAGLFGAAVRAKLETASVSLADSVAVEHGRYALTVMDKADTSKVLGSDTGNYVVEWKKRDGSWKMSLDAVVTERPAAPAAPAAAGAGAAAGAEHQDH
jgi:uncharacterized protein (TIGR02246 family)